MACLLYRVLSNNGNQYDKIESNAFSFRDRNPY